MAKRISALESGQPLWTLGWCPCSLFPGISNLPSPPVLGAHARPNKERGNGWMG
jgi:hypothetical protein